MNRSSQRGSAIIMLFIAVALFGMISYAFLQGTRGGTGMIKSEADKAATYQGQDCANAVAMGMKRLKSRGCTGANISLAEDGTTGSGPADGSCALFHPSGGGVKACGADLSAYDPCSEGPLGSTCVDGAFYVGEIGGVRRYAAAGDLPGRYAFAPAGTYPGAASDTDGKNNTDVLFAASGNNPLYAPVACRALGAKWYVPAQNELQLLVTNQADLNLGTRGFYSTWEWHMSSRGWSNGYLMERIHDGPNQNWGPTSDTNTNMTRCFRQ